MTGATKAERINIAVHFSNEQSYFGKSNKLTITNKFNTGKFIHKSFEFTRENFYFVATLLPNPAYGNPVRKDILFPAKNTIKRDQ
jgi:hypothetical protein